MPTLRKEPLRLDSDITQAINSGEVDALVVTTAIGDQLFTLQSNDQAYRKIIEQMSEGALTVSVDGIVLFANQSFANMLNVPLEQVIGSSIFNWVTIDQRELLQSQLKFKDESVRRFELSLTTQTGVAVPIYLSVTLMRDETANFFSLVANDLTEQKRLAAIVASKKLAQQLLTASEQSRHILNQLLSEQEAAKNKISEQLLQLKDNLKDTVHAIATIVEMRDPYTAGHQVRVTALAAAIATEMGLPADQIEAIEVAGMVHDLGKIQTPAEILSKPGEISELEHNLIKTHPQAGYDILKGIHFPWPIADIVLQHHERLDGSGYPHGLKDSEILLAARILSVADVVEAMSSHRPYRASLGIDAALAEIAAHRGTLFDPQVVDACTHLIQEKKFSLASPTHQTKQQRPNLTVKQ
jgi:PAS domain S-box-containing protein/putative nucleotidyltransferase with HDIG domain